MVAELIVVGCVAVTTYVALASGEELLRKVVRLWRSRFGMTL